MRNLHQIHVYILFPINKLVNIIQLVKDFTAERTCDEVEFYMGMIMDDQQTFDGLVNHLKNSFQLGETMSELISNFYGNHQKNNELEDVFADDLQILVRKS